jgi:carbamoyltransferase
MLDGKVIAAAQEERFTRIKHDASFPSKSIEFCLEYAKIDMKEVEIVAFYEKPFQKFDRIIDVFSRNTPVGFLSFRKAMKSWLADKLWIPNIIQKNLNYKGKILFIPHHESHAASAFFSSPFYDSTIVVMDAVGEKTSTSISVGKANKIEILEEQLYPHSLGLFYSAFTYYCGFKVNSGEYKLMGLAPYGIPKYVDEIKADFITVNEDGAISLNLKNYDFEVGLKMLSKNGLSKLELPVNADEINIDQYYKDIAASVQKITEEVVSKTIFHAVEITGCKNVVLAGGVALNCKTNGEILNQGIIDQLWVQPAAGDAGGAVGAAQIAHYHFLDNKREIISDSPLSHVYLGPLFSKEQVEAELLKFNVSFLNLNETELPIQVAKSLADKKIVGWFQDRAEFGPRALGNRSILASPLYSDMKQHINSSIKKREGFRPFAPVVKEDKAKEWFDINGVSKYMLITYTSNQKETIPSCVHTDNTARVQTVTKQDNPKLYDLIDYFEKESDCPVLINTSFNVRGEPIVGSPEDALRCFFQTDMDVLVLENYVIHKSKNTNTPELLLKPNNFELD